MRIFPSLQAMKFTVNFLKCAINSTTIKLFYAVQFFFFQFSYTVTFSSLNIKMTLVNPRN